MTALAAGLPALYWRRLQLSLKGAAAMIGQLASPILWVLVVGPALASTLGQLTPGVDYYTYVAVSQIAFVVPFTAMFAGTTVIRDRLFGIMPELTVAPIRRFVYPLANAAATLTIAAAQTVLMLALAEARGAHLDLSAGRLVWLVAGAALLCLALYGCAETLAHHLPRFEVYGPLIPAIGVTPFLLCGSYYPLTSLPGWIQAISKVLPWTHAVALIRADNPPGLDRAGVALDPLSASDPVDPGRERDHVRFVFGNTQKHSVALVAAPGVVMGEVDVEHPV